MHPTWEEPPDLIAAKKAAAAASPSKPKTNAAEAAVAAANHAKHQADRAAKQRSPLEPGEKNSPVKDQIRRPLKEFHFVDTFVCAQRPTAEILRPHSW